MLYNIHANVLPVLLRFFCWKIAQCYDKFNTIMVMRGES